MSVERDLPAEMVASLRDGVEELLDSRQSESFSKRPSR